MFIQIFLFELYYRLRRPTTWIYFILLLVIMFGTIAIDGITFAGNTIYKNSPMSIALAFSFASAFGMLVTSAMFSVTIQRDYETGIYPLFFTTSISKASYLLGRFAGTFVVTALIFTSLPLGILHKHYNLTNAGVDRCFAYRAQSPGLLPATLFDICVAQHFCCRRIVFYGSYLTRKMLFAYLANVVLLVAYLIALFQQSDMENIKTFALVDPFGLMSISDVVRYWTTSEENLLLIPFIGTILYNRVIWVLAASVVLAACYSIFKFRSPANTGRKQKAEGTESHLDLSQLPKTIPSYTLAQSI